MLGVGGNGGGQEGGQRSRRIVSRNLKGDIASQEKRRMGRKVFRPQGTTNVGWDRRWIQVLLEMVGGKAKRG